MYTTGGNVGIRLDGLHGSYLKHMEINAKHHQSKLFIILRIFKTSQLKRVARGETRTAFESTHIYNSSQIQNYTRVRSAHSDPTHIQCGKSCELSVICMQQIMWLLKASCHAILRAMLPAWALHFSLNAVHVPASFVSLLQTNCFIQSYVSVSLWMHIPASVASFLKTNCFIQA